MPSALRASAPLTSEVGRHKRRTAHEDLRPSSVPRTPTLRQAHPLVLPHLVPDDCHALLRSSARHLAELRRNFRCHRIRLASQRRRHGHDESRSLADGSTVPHAVLRIQLFVADQGQGVLPDRPAECSRLAGRRRRVPAVRLGRDGVENAQPDERVRQNVEERKKEFACGNFHRRAERCIIKTHTPTAFPVLNSAQGRPRFALVRIKFSYKSVT
jgi:hypothetical protein